MPNIIHIQRYLPDPEGNGGSHRMYQIYQELITAFGSANVGVVNPSQNQSPSQPGIEYFSKRIREGLELLEQIIIKRGQPRSIRNYLLESNIIKENPFGNTLLDSYLQFISKNGKPKICITDYPSLLEIARFNKANKIVTIYCPQNLEALTNMSHCLGNIKNRSTYAIQSMTEMEMLEISDDRLVISLLELSIINGLGKSACYYPYLPVGEIKNRLQLIRKKRLENPPQRGLFLMIGSVFHGPTGEGFRWFLENAAKHKLNENLRIIVGGRMGDTLAVEFSGIPGVEITGRLEPNKMDQLMIQASAVLIPQLSGFGAVTRITEASCAGIPVIAANHSGKAMLPPPGVKFVGNNWLEWISAMQLVLEEPITSDFSAFENWELSLPHPLEFVVNKYLERGI